MDELFDPFTMPLHLRRELIAEGWHDRAIAAMVRSGTWIRPRRGAYADRSAFEQLDDAGRHVVQTRAVVTQADTDVIVSHTSAVPFWAGPSWVLEFSYGGNPGVGSLHRSRNTPSRHPTAGSRRSSTSLGRSWARTSRRTASTST